MKRKLKELIELENPKEDPGWMNILRYLLEYYPGKAWDLFQRKKLEKYLDDRTTQLVNLETELAKSRPWDQAKEIAHEAIMPSETDLPEQEIFPTELEDRQRKILAWAEEVRSRPRKEL